jgi:Domain of unknown function (DUF397)
MSGWRKSSHCAAGDCIEISQSENRRWIWIRSGQFNSFPVTPDEWESFVKGIKAGEFDDLAD